MITEPLLSRSRSGIWPRHPCDTRLLYTIRLLSELDMFTNSPPRCFPLHATASSSLLDGTNSPKVRYLMSRARNSPPITQRFPPGMRIRTSRVTRRRASVLDLRSKRQTTNPCPLHLRTRNTYSFPFSRVICLPLQRCAMTKVSPHDEKADTRTCRGLILQRSRGGGLGICCFGRLGKVLVGCSWRLARDGRGMVVGIRDRWRRWMTVVVVVVHRFSLRGQRFTRIGFLGLV